MRFTNGLKVYLSGDTDPPTEMKSVVNEFHKANLAMLGTASGERRLTDAVSGSSAPSNPPLRYFMQNPDANSCKAGRPRQSRIAAFPRAASVGIALIGLYAVVACQVIPGHASPGRAGETVKGIPPAATHVGEFSGTYHDGLPVYLFPTIHVIGHRSAD